MKFERTRIMGALAAVLMMLVGMMAVPATASAEPLALEESIATEDGATDMLGGGEHFFLKFGSDAAFGIVWGTEGDENCVHFVAIKARYLGLADVYNRDGEMVEADHTIKIYTMYTVKLDSLLEFNDTDDDGLLTYNRTFEGGEFTDYRYDEPLYKKVDLNTAWTQSEVQETSTDEAREWEFSLTATDLPYEIIDENATVDVGDNVLNELTLTFHLVADLVQMDNVSLPQWRITVTSGPLGKMTFMTADKMEDTQVSGKIFKYDVKWDEEIVGWDFDPANENPALLMELKSLVGNFISPYMATWMEMTMLQYMNAVGVMNCATTAGDLEVNETTGTLEGPKEVIRTRLTFGSDWTKIGYLTWADDVTVDGEPELVKAQIMAGHGVVAMARVAGDLATFTGFVVLGGLVFPGGNTIFHDPTFTTEALVDVESNDGPQIPMTLVLLAAAAILIVAVVAATMAGGSGRKPGQGTRNNYETTRSSQPGEWSKYYSNKK